MSLRVQITGSRDFTSVMIMNEVLGAIPEKPKNITVVHGGAPGADTLAGATAKLLGMSVEVFPANWARYGKLAGPIRNVEMLDTRPDFVLAFFKAGAANIGTGNMVREARLRGIPVSEYWED